MKLEPVAWQYQYHTVRGLLWTTEVGWNHQEPVASRPLYAIPEGYALVKLGPEGAIPQWLLDVIDSFASCSDTDDEVWMEHRRDVIRKLREWQAMIAAIEGEQ